MGAYADDRVWSDRFINELRRIVGPYLLVPSSFEVDTQQAADLVVFRGRDVTVACRVRRHGYADQYPYDFTIRSNRATGARTELEKIIDGWGDWFLYGHATADGHGLARWMLLDLSAFRAALIRAPESVRMQKKDNGDGTKFRAIDVRSLPKSVLVASSHDITFFKEGTEHA